MSKFHVNPESGQVGACRAAKGNCPFGGESGTENHYDDKQEAYNASVGMLAQRFGSFSTHSAAKRYEERIFAPEVSAADKKSLLKEYLDTHGDEVRETLEDNAISGDGRDPEEVLEYASDRVVATAVAQAQEWKNAGTYYESLADVFVALDQAAQTDYYEQAHRDYQEERLRRGQPLEEHEIDDVYSDDPAKAAGLKQMQAEAASRPFATGEQPWSEDRISFKDLKLVSAGDFSEDYEEEWTSAHPEVQRSATQLAARLEGFNLTAKDEDLENIIEDMRHADRPYEWSDLLERTYDWADRKRVWLDQ